MSVEKFYSLHACDAALFSSVVLLEKSVAETELKLLYCSDGTVAGR